jgi:diaminopimelate decarboxylase
MDYFLYRNGELWAEDVRVKELVASHGSPLYIYSQQTLERHFHAFEAALKGVDHITCYSAKANANLSILRLLGGWGAGVDIVSGGELARALAVDIDPRKIVYSGVGKRADEIKKALAADILMFNVESIQELQTIAGLAQTRGSVARISLRINPDVDPLTHPYISTGMKENKFGLSVEEAFEAYLLAKQNAFLDPVGIDCHIGSQLIRIDPFIEAFQKVLDFTDKLQEAGISIHYLDIGGGLGITYDEETPPQPAELGQAIAKVLNGRKLTIIQEPGRAIAGNAGILVTQVLYTKRTTAKNFVIVDAAMNDLVRPALYGSYHRVGEVTPKGRDKIIVDVVGPICESSDFLAKDRPLPEVRPEEYLAVFSAGAYGFVMSSQYNSRPRAAELIVHGKKVHLARRRETYADLMALE